MKVAVATISFTDTNDRRTIYWYGECEEFGGLYVKDEGLGIKCSLENAKEEAKKAFPEEIWDLDLIDSFLAIWK